MKIKVKASRPLCMEIGRAIGALEANLMSAVHNASEGRADVAREILGTVASTMDRFRTKNFFNSIEVKDIRAKLSDAISQKTPSMVERKAKRVYDDLIEAERRAGGMCR